jgi:hypothetical protein
MSINGVMLIPAATRLVIARLVFMRLKTPQTAPLFPAWL